MADKIIEKNGNLNRSGRPKGAKGKLNKTTIREILTEKGINPLEKLLEIFDSCEEESNRVKIALYLCDHVYGKPKPLPENDEPTGENVKITMARKDLIAIAKGE